MREDGFKTTNEYLKAEFNEPLPPRFGFQKAEKQSTPRWRQEETSLFYLVLSMCGTDFSMMSKFFPKRTRKMILTKFHYEEARNKARIHSCRAPRPWRLR
jgi:transcription factor TFIIIB component B''